MTENGLRTAVILAGGKSLRYSAGRSEHKALGRIGDRSLLLHSIDFLARQGMQRVIVCTGAHTAEFECHLDSEHALLQGLDVAVVDTGLKASTAERLLQAAALISDDLFLVSYCDVLSDLSLADFADFHNASGCAASVVAVNPPEPYGLLQFSGDRLTAFQEKKASDTRWVNAGYFLVSRPALEAITDPALHWEQGALPTLARSGDLAGYRHRGYWIAVETQKERLLLDSLCRDGNAPWLCDAPRPRRVAV